MARKDDLGNPVSTASSFFSTRLRYALLGVAVIGASIGIRAFWPTDQADAQVPRSRQVNQRKLSTGGKNARTARQTTPTSKPRSVGDQNVVAMVNGEPITKPTLGKLCLARWGEDTLESLVNKHLITQECQRRGVQITDKDIDAEIQEIARKFNLTVEHWLKMLREERDVSVQQYRRDIIWPTLALRELAADRLKVTQEQLEKEFESEYGAKVQVRMISLTSQAAAQKVLKLAKAKPSDFPALAKQYSEDPATASARGLIPLVRRHLGEPAIEQVVFSLKPGEVSNIVQAANQFLIFRCEKHIPAATISPQYRQTAMKQLEDRIVERNLRSAAGDLFEKLQSKAKVVNVWNDAKLRQQSPGIAALVNNKQISIEQLMEECLARYGRDMLETEINFRLLRQALKQRKLAVTGQEIQQEIARAAESFGYLKKDGTPDSAQWIQEVTEQEGIGRNEYVRDAVWPSVALKRLVGNQVAITQEDLQKGFEANYGTRVEVLAIVLGRQRVAEEVWDMARKNPSREFFGQLAEQYSIESVSRANFGEIPPIRRHGGQPQIEREAFQLKPGELSAIVAMGDKFVIMKCLGHTQPIVDKLADVKDELTKDIREKKIRLAMAEEFDRLKESAQIHNFLQRTWQTGKVPASPASTTKSLKRKRAVPPSRGRAIELQTPGQR